MPPSCVSIVDDFVGDICGDNCSLVVGVTMAVGTPVLQHMEVLPRKNADDTVRFLVDDDKVPVE